MLERLFTVWCRGLVYTQIWEDPRVDVKALQLDDTSRILIISSAGCNVLNYLAYEPARIVAVDVNTAHMALPRLRIAGLRHLPDHDAFACFRGLASPVSRLGHRAEKLLGASPGALRRSTASAFRRVSTSACTTQPPGPSSTCIATD